MQYRFTCHYQSELGAWRAGDVAEFDDDTAAWLLRDVKDCIVAVDAQDAPDEAEFDDDTAAWLLRDVAGCIVAVEPQDDAGAPEDESRSLDTPSHDRQLKRAPRKRSA